MAVLSRDFGGLKLSGRDAETFVRQVASGERSDAVDTSLARGRDLFRTMAKDGKVVVNVQRTERKR